MNKFFWGIFGKFKFLNNIKKITACHNLLYSKGEPGSTCVSWFCSTPSRSALEFRVEIQTWLFLLAYKLLNLGAAA